MENKIFQPFIEHFINKAIDAFLTEPNKTLSRLGEQDMFGVIVKNLRENPQLIRHLQKTLAHSDRKTSIRFLLHAFRSLNKPKPKILHFDFIKNQPLQSKEIESLFKKADNLLYACFFLRSLNPDLVRILQKTESLFFLILENPELDEDMIKTLKQTENLCLLLPAEDLGALRKGSQSLKGFFFGSHVYLNNRNLINSIDEEFLYDLESTGIAFLVYIREEKLNVKNNRLYEDFLDKYRYRFFPLIDFHRDQKNLLDKLPLRI